MFKLEITSIEHLAAFIKLIRNPDDTEAIKEITEKLKIQTTDLKKVIEKGA